MLKLLIFKSIKFKDKRQFAKIVGNFRGIKEYYELKHDSPLKKIAKVFAGKGFHRFQFRSILTIY